MLILGSTTRFLRVEQVPNVSDWNILRNLSWETKPRGETFHSGNGEETSHVIPLKRHWTPKPQNRDTYVVGDISAVLTKGTCALVEISNPQRDIAVEMARQQKLLGEGGYYPVEAGQFLQLMSMLQGSGILLSGTFLCWQGRKPGYAIAAVGHRTNGTFTFHLTFDVETGEGFSNLQHIDCSNSVYAFFLQRTQQTQLALQHTA